MLNDQAEKVLLSNMQTLMKMYDETEEIAHALYDLARASKPDVATPAMSVLEKYGFVKEGVWVDE